MGIGDSSTVDGEHNIDVVLAFGDLGEYLIGCLLALSFGVLSRALGLLSFSPSASLKKSSVSFHFFQYECCLLRPNCVCLKH